MRITITYTAMLTVLTFALASCVQADSKTGARAESTAGAPAKSTAAAKAADAPKETWRSLLETKTAKGWRGWASPDLPKGWKVTEGVISKDGEVDDLVTREEFANFELKFEWKLDKAGNSGVFYRGTREYDHIYWSAPEYQLLDDANAPDGRNRLTSAAAAYSLYPAPADVVHAFDTWNTSRIVVNGAHVEHWLNGQKVVQYELWSPGWEAKVKASKFKDWPNYGRAKSGYLAIQGDHDGALALRNIKLRTLP
jgi:hypothetical protein